MDPPRPSRCVGRTFPEPYRRGYSLLVGLVGTDANADTPGVKLALDQSVSFVADKQRDLLFGSGLTLPGVLVTDGAGNTITRISTPPASQTSHPQAARSAGRLGSGTLSRPGRIHRIMIQFFMEVLPENACSEYALAGIQTAGRRSDAVSGD